RLKPVLAVVYLIFNEGYTASSGDELIRADLCAEAIRLARLLVELMPDESEGRLVLLPDQDRTRWDAGLIAEGQALVRACLRRNRPGPYQIQAAVNAVHSDSPTAAGTDWSQILALYDQLLAMAPTPVVALNRAVALAEVKGPAAALVEIDALDLPDYHLFHAIRADLLTRLARHAEAADAYEAALTRASNAAEQAFLAGRAARARQKALD